MKPDDIKRSWDGIAALFTVCLRRGTFQSIPEVQAALNDMAVVEAHLKASLAKAAPPEVPPEDHQAMPGHDPSVDHSAVE